MWKQLAIASSISSVLLAGVILLYVMTPIFDEWAIEYSLQRFCSVQKEAFEGEFFTPAYLCTFIDPS